MASQYSGQVKTDLPVPAQVPDDGDQITADSVNQAYRQLKDYAMTLSSALASVPLVRLVSMQSLDGDTIQVSAIRQMVSHRATGPVEYTYRSLGLASIGAAQLEGGGVFGASTWYYVYLQNSAGVLSYQISTVIPDATMCWKGPVPDLRYQYIGAIRTGNTGKIINFSKRGNVTRFAQFFGFTGYNGTLSDAGTETEVAIPMPSTTTTAMLRFDLAWPSTTNEGAFSFRPKLATGIDFLRVQKAAAVGSPAIATITETVAINLGSVVLSQNAVAGSSMTYTIYHRGFVE